MNPAAPNPATHPVTHDVVGDAIFILGNHRSGTTILYHLMAAAGRNPCPGPFHLARHRARCAGMAVEPLDAMTARWLAAGIADRTVDGIAVSPLAPEEYGFALPNGCIDVAGLPAFVRFCADLRADPARPVDPGAPLLLKNPRDFPRFAHLAALFPRARFVFIHRRPEATVASRLRELVTLARNRSAYQAEIEPAYVQRMANPPLRLALQAGLSVRPGVAAWFAAEWLRNARVWANGIDALAPERWFALRFEDLCADPAGTLEPLFAFAGIPADRLGSAVAMVGQPRASPPAPWPTATRAFSAAAAPVLARAGYRCAAMK